MTQTRLRIHPAARAEIEAVRRYHARQRAGLGRAFLAEVEAALAFALTHPELYEAFSTADPAVRRALLHRFPYALVYEIRGSRLLEVLACFDLRQEQAPEWSGRRT